MNDVNSVKHTINNVNYKYKIRGNWLRVWREDWQGNIGWDELQTIKNLAFGEEVGAVEIYPPQSEVVNKMNMRHLWVLPDTQLPKLADVLADYFGPEVLTGTKNV